MSEKKARYSTAPLNHETHKELKRRALESDLAVVNYLESRLKLIWKFEDDEISLNELKKQILGD